MEYLPEAVLHILKNNTVAQKWMLYCCFGIIAGTLGSWQGMF